MSYTKNNTLKRVIAMVFVVIMMISTIPTNVFAFVDSYADVTTLTGGTVNNNDTANVEVIVEETTLQWVEANSLRTEGWWVGVEVKAPEGFSADATYKSKGNPADEYSAAKNFADMKDGEDFIQLWFPVSPESLVKFANERRNITMMYTFDWDADGTYEQELTFSVVPSESIVLMKGTEQVYPVIDKYADVTTLTGGTVNNNDTANVEVIVEETTLQWVEANSLRTEGWWVGVEVKAPEGFSADATYKSKGNPADEYSAAKNFADMKDGEDFIQLWFPVSPESLVKFANEGRNITMMYTFDWDADDTYEQELTFSVVPSESIVLMKGTEQVYPVITYEVSVEKNGSGTVKINNAENTTTFVERNSDVVVTVVATEGYQISSVKIGGEDVVVPDASTEFTTTIETIKADTEIDVVFVKVYTATVTHNGTGTGVSNPENGGSVTVETGETIIVTATPDEGNRVVMVTINGVEDTTVSKENDSDYSYSISAEDDYEFVITFAPNVYDITLSAASNGTAESTDVSVEYDKNTTVYLTPADGYTVDEVYVNGTKCDDIIVDNTGIYFNISNIKSEINVTATFKEIATASLSDVVVDKSEVLREDETNRLLIIKNGSSVTLSTEKEGIKVYDANGIIGGDEATQSVTIDFETTVTKIELYYKDADEYYKNWHTVEFGDLSIVVDEGDNVVASLEPTTPANINGYYNSDVIFNVSAEDTGDYSGLDFVEYWITCDGIESTKITLYEYVTEINNTFEDGVSLVVDSTEYNSDDIKVTLHVVDRAGNETTVEKEIKINSTKPTVSLDIEDVAKLDKAQDGYYNGDRTLTITIIDRETTFSETNVLAGLAIKKNGENVVVYASDITWTHIDDTHIGKYTFTGDGHYEWSLSYENLAGLVNDGVTAPEDKAIYDFYIDTQAPTDLAITYTPNFVDTLLETITFGFYNAPVTVKIEATDMLSGVCEFVYSYTVEDGASSVNSGVSNVVISAANINYDGDKASATFEIPAQFRGKVKFSATDKAGKTAELIDEDRVVVVDNIAPGVNVIYDNNEVQNDKYYSAPRTATIEIEEANFFQQDIDNGLLAITRTTILNDGTFTEETLNLDFTKSEDDVYVATVEFNEDADYIFEITYTDRSGNTDAQSTYSTEFTVDTTTPEVSVSFDNNIAINENQFMNPRKATITVVEHNFNENGMVVKVNGNPYTVAWNPVENVADTYYAEVPFEGDEHYTFSVNGVDYANNADNGTQYAEGTVAPETFTVDTTAPTDLTVTYETEFVGILFEGLTFGFYKAPVKVTIQAKDNISGIDYFEYSYVAQDGASDINEGKENVLVDVDGTTASATFEIPAQFRGCVSFKATNNAGRTTKITDEDRIVVVDNIAPGITVEYDNENVRNGKYYDAPRKATIKIEEANFFQQDIDDGLLVITRTTILNDGTSTEETLNLEFTKSEGDVYVATVDFAQDADYKFDIKYTDRAGNVYDNYPEDDFVVDTTAPEVSVSFDNNIAINENQFMNPRKATITVVEHNFNENGMVVKVNGNPYTVAWNPVENVADTYYAEVPFEGDEHYTFSVNGVDYANNADNGTQYAEGTVAPETFTVDTTAPTDLTVTYETEFVGILFEGLTFGFYKAPVKVTIQAKDNISGIDYFEYSYVAQDGASDINEGKENVLVDVDGTTASATFEIPAQFRGCVSFKATNNAGITFSYKDDRIVVVDNVAPGVTISWTPDDSTANNSKYYKSDRTATIYIDEANFFVKDYENGLLVITRKAVYDDGSEKEEILTPDLTKNGDIYTTTVDFTENADYTFEITYKDRSGNIEEKSTYYTEFVIDKTVPNVYFEELANGKHYQNRTVKVYVEEHNFRAEDFVFTAEAHDVYGNAIDLSSKNYESYFADENNWTEKQDNLWVAEVPFDIEGHYTISAKYTDLAGNEQKSDASDTFCIDSTKPVIEVTYNDDEVEYENENQFRTNRLATIVITEHNFDAKDIFVKVMKGENGLVEDTEYLEATDFAEYLNDVNKWVPVDGEVDVYTATIEFEEGHYTFEIGYTDKADNVNEPVDFADSVAPQEFTVDTTKPTDMKIIANVEDEESTIKEVSIIGSETEIAFDTFFSKEITIKLSANCDISGLQSLKYQKVVSVLDYKENGTWVDYDDETGIVISPTEKFVLYFRAEDRAGNVKIVNSTGVVVDNKEPVGETKAPEIDILPATPNTNGIHSKDVNVDIKVIDPKYIGEEVAEEGYYSGLQKIVCEISTNDTDAKETIVLFDRDGKPEEKEGATFDEDALATTWEGNITIDANKFNSNKVIVKIIATDNAGNTRTSCTAEGDIKIDVTAPKISVSYDNNNADSGKYFKADRVATIVITERNFDPSKVVVSSSKSIGTFTESKGTGNGDDTKWTAKIYYNTDGKYSFAISYTDLAGNACDSKSVNYGSSVAPTEFVIDKTIPTVQVTYDNNSATNGNYYNQTRTATISITEQNFDSNRVNIHMTATDDGTSVALPVVGTWETSGSVNTATIVYDSDAYYTFDIDLKDMAGNIFDNFDEESFYIDTTLPTLEITEVLDGSANSGEVTPIVTYSDTNLDISEVEIVLTGANRGMVEFDGKNTPIHNGNIFEFKNFAEEKAVDDIYTLTARIADMAGNESTETITFSVNRFGSTYEMSSETKKLIENYYVQNVINDIVITEINADKLLEYAVTLNDKLLTKDVDYSVVEEGGNGQWMKYTYTISKSLFANEGEYNLVVSSKDMAENDAFSDVKDAAINFVVDRTAPVVTITGMTSGGRYQTDVQTVTVIPTDDGGALNSITVLLVDNDGITISKLVDLSGDALQEHLANNDGKIEFVINDGLYQNVRVICDDLSVDENGNTNTYDEIFDSVSVSSSALMIFWANKPLRWGTIGGTSFVVLAVSAIIIIIKKRKR